MKALLLNSGIGSRMGDLTKDRPKCMVSLKEGQTILSRQVWMLHEAGIREFVVTIGPFGDLIPDYLEQEFPGIRFDFIRNEAYDKTNYIYSMHLAKALIEEDLILMHGDIVLEQGVLVQLLSDGRNDLVVVDSLAPLPEKDFKCVVEDGHVREIGIHPALTGKQLFLLPVYRLSAGFMKGWMEEIGRFVQEGNTKVYAENAFNSISGGMQLQTMDIRGAFCMEVDTLEDLAVAREKVSCAARM